MTRPRQATHLCNALLLSTLLTPASAMADSNGGRTEFSAEVGIGAEYDSNVSIDELDVSASQSDYALLLDAELQLEQQTFFSLITFKHWVENKSPHFPCLQTKLLCHFDMSAFQMGECSRNQSTQEDNG